MHSGMAFALFPTTLGPCALAWDDADAIAAATLPEPDDEAARRAIRRRSPAAVESAPPPAVADAAAAVRELIHHGRADLTHVRLDLAAVPDFDRRVYEIVRTITPGSTLSYGEVAERLGQPGASRAVGRAMGRNPFPPIVPCHRVLAADGLGGFSAPGGARTKRRLLEIEGALPTQTPLFEL